jgi:hypothetical protein
MSRNHKDRDDVYAVIRWDGFHGTNTAPEVLVTVKEIVRSQELAEAARTPGGKLVDHHAHARVPVERSRYRIEGHPQVFVAAPPFLSRNRLGPVSGGSARDDRGPSVGGHRELQLLAGHGHGHRPR